MVSALSAAGVGRAQAQCTQPPLTLVLDFSKDCGAENLIQSPNVQAVGCGVTAAGSVTDYVAVFTNEINYTVIDTNGEQIALETQRGDRFTGDSVVFQGIPGSLVGSFTLNFTAFNQYGEELTGLLTVGYFLEGCGGGNALEGVYTGLFGAYVSISRLPSSALQPTISRSGHFRYYIYLQLNVPDYRRRSHGRNVLGQWCQWLYPSVLLDVPFSGQSFAMIVSVCGADVLDSIRSALGTDDVPYLLKEEPLTFDGLKNGLAEIEGFGDALSDVSSYKDLLVKADTWGEVFKAGIAGAGSA